MSASRPKRARVRNAALAALSGLASMVGCNSNVQEQIELAHLAQTCLVNSDCKTPLVCAFESCHAECETSRDCQDGARCVAAARPFKVCQLEEERSCEHTADCAEGLVCGVDGECRDQCVADSDCVEGQRCVSGTCADIEELDDSGELPVAQGMARGSEGSPCVYVSDCSAALLCRDRSCLAECKADRDCAAGKICQETRCVPDGMQPTACDYSSDCQTEGQRCLAGGCYCMCAENRDCPKNQVCNGCGCEPDPSAPPSCVYNSDCEIPGQTCQDRECACECKTNADCSGNSRCDGCGCFDPKLPVDGIVRGSVTIESSLQLPIYEGVSEIVGDLFITGTQLSELGTTFDQLIRIQGRLVINSNGKLTHVAFPALREADWISIGSMSNLTTIEMPSLTRGELDLGNLQNVETIDLDSLVTGSIQAFSLQKLKGLSLPAATTLQGLHLSDTPSVEEVRMPELKTLTGTVAFTSSSEASLRVLSAPKLEFIGGSYFAISNSQLETLTDFGHAGWQAPLLGLEITNNAKLSNCAIADFVERVRDGGYEYSVTVTNNLPCPECQGPHCPS